MTQHRYSPVSPYFIVHDGAAAVDFYARAFGAAVTETNPREGKLAHVSAD